MIYKFLGINKRLLEKKNTPVKYIYLKKNDLSTVTNYLHFINSYIWKWRRGKKTECGGKGCCSPHLSSLEAVRAERAGVVVDQVTFDVDHVGPRSPHPHHVEPLPRQVVAWDEGGFLTL